VTVHYAVVCLKAYEVVALSEDRYNHNKTCIYKYYTTVCFRPCETVYIPEHVDSLFNIDQIKQIQQQLESTINELENAIKLRGTCLQAVLIMVERS